MTEPIRVLIADDHPLFRDGLTALLTDGPDTELVGAATSGTEAVDLARETQPDVVVMDLHMPGLNGVEATRRIVADSPHITVLVLTMFDDDDSIFSALRAGARGYLLKGADQEQIRAAIRAAANGEIIFGTQLAARMLAYFTTSTSAPPPVFPLAVLSRTPASTAWKPPAGTFEQLIVGTTNRTETFCVAAADGPAEYPATWPATAAPAAGAVKSCPAVSPIPATDSSVVFGRRFSGGSGIVSVTMISAMLSPSLEVPFLPPPATVPPCAACSGPVRAR